MQCEVNLIISTNLVSHVLVLFYYYCYTFIDFYAVKQAIKYVRLKGQMSVGVSLHISEH